MATGSESRLHADAALVPDAERRGPAADGGGDAGPAAAPGPARAEGRAFADEEADRPSVGRPVLWRRPAPARHGRRQGAAARGVRRTRPRGGPAGTGVSHGAVSKVSAWEAGSARAGSAGP